MQLNCRILDSRLIYHDEGTLTGSECVVGGDRHSNEIESTVMKAKTHSLQTNSLQNGIDKHLEL